MDKVAYYENTILESIFEKTAERAWKKHFNELSQDSQNILVDKKILNYKKEYSGLKKGTKNIAKKQIQKLLKIL